MSTLATSLFPLDLDVLLVFLARAHDAINAGEVRYNDKARFAATVSALKSHMSSLDGISFFPDSLTIVATPPARDALYNMLRADGDDSFDVAIKMITIAIDGMLAMFRNTKPAWRTHPVFAQRQQEWNFLDPDYIVLDWLIADSPNRFKFVDARDQQPKAPAICTMSAAARPLIEGKLAFLMPDSQGGQALVCPRNYLKSLKTHYTRVIIAATMLIARLGFLSQDSGFCMDRSGVLARRLLTLIQRCRLARFDMPENLDKAMSDYCNGVDGSTDPADQDRLRRHCVQALLNYSRPWLHEQDSQIASLFRGWMVTVGPGTLVDRAAIVCPGAAISGACTIGAGAIVRNGAWVAPYAVLVAGQIVTASGSILNAGGHDVSSRDVPTGSHNSGPSTLLPAPYQNAALPSDDIDVPFTIAKAPVEYQANSPGMARASGSASLWLSPVAGDLHRGGVNSAAQSTTGQSPISTTTTTTTTTPPPLSRKRPRPSVETQRDMAPPSSRQRTAPQGWPAPGANAWPYPETTRAHPQKFTWIQDPGAMPPRQTTKPPALPFVATYSHCDAPPSPSQVAQTWPQDLRPETPRSSTPRALWSPPAPSAFNPPSNAPEQPDSGFRVDATPPFVHNREQAYQHATTTEASAFLSNDILQFPRVPPPLFAPAPVLYSGRGNSRATPDDDAPRATPPQPSLPLYISPSQASGVGRSPAIPRSVASQFTLKKI